MSSSGVNIAHRTLALVHRRPLLSAIVVVCMLLFVGIVVFQPSYDTNDDTTMSLIVAGKAVTDQPDEHMIFTHFLVGLLLKQLYLWAPSVPWYGLYLFAVHACAHVALLYLLLKQRLGWGWLLIYLVYASMVGLLLLTALQFTTTAYLAAQSGFFLGWFAFIRAVDGEHRLARRCGIAGAVFLLLAALIRWHVFMLFLSLAIPTACVLTWVYRRHRRLLAVGGGLTALTLAVVIGVSLLNYTYYRSDARWRNFYSYNELRARVNDLSWVYYSPETAHVFPQVGWSVNDYAMIEAWFFDDPAVYNAEKLQELLAAYPWRESRPAENRIGDLFTALVNDPQVVPLLALVPLIALILKRNRTAQKAFLLTCVWVCVVLWATTALRKPPPPRIYLPLLSFPVALALFLRAALPTAAAKANPPSNTASQSRGPEKFRTALRLTMASGCALLAAFGVASNLNLQLDRTASTSQRREQFYRELESITSQSDKLFICWGGGLPYELLSPLDNLQRLSNLHMLHFGCLQQCPFHADMKRRFGIEDLPREIGDRPDVTLICHPACLQLMSNYIREHHGRDVQFKQAGRFLTAVVAHAISESSPTMASAAQPDEKPQRQ